MVSVSVVCCAVEAMLCLVQWYSVALVCGHWLLQLACGKGAGLRCREPGGDVDGEVETYFNLPAVRRSPGSCMSLLQSLSLSVHETAGQRLDV
jgi:hypothetical protein